MKKNLFAGLAAAVLCLLLFLPAAPAETRQGVIAREGMEEAIRETRFESPEGYSFWYADEWLNASFDGAGSAVVRTLYSDDYMMLSVIPESDVRFAGDSGEGSPEQAAGPRVEICVYTAHENGRVRFLTVVGENGRYLRAMGDYAEEAAEGNAKFFQLVLDSVAFDGDNG